MLNIYLHLCVLLQLHNGLLITCEYVKLTSIRFINPVKVPDKNSIWHPLQKSISENLERKKRVSHHGTSHHHIQKVSLNLLSDRSTSKPIVIHHLNQKKLRSQQLECNKRHIAFEVYAKRLNQTINGTDEKRSDSHLSVFPSVTSFASDYQSGVLKRNGNSKPILNSVPISVTPVSGALLASSTAKYINVTTLTPLTTTQSHLSSILTTTSAATRSLDSKNLKVNLLESLAGADKISGIYSEPSGRTVLTKVFIIPIQERVPTITKYKIRSDDDKSSKRREFNLRVPKKKKKTSKGPKKQKHSSKEKKNKNPRVIKQKESGKFTKGGRNKQNRKMVIDRKKRLEEKANLKENRKKSGHEERSHKNKNIETHRKTKSLNKEVENIHECRRDKSKDSHKNLEKQRKDVSHTKENHASNEVMEIRKVHEDKKKSVHKMNKANKSISHAKTLKGHLKPTKEKNESRQRQHKDKGIKSTHKTLDKKAVQKDRKKCIDEMEKATKIVSQTEAHSNTNTNDLGKHQKLTKDKKKSPQRQHKDNDKEAAHNDQKQKAVHKDKNKSTDGIKNKKRIASHIETYSNNREMGMEGHQKLTKNKNEIPQRKRKINRGGTSHANLENKVVQKYEKKSTKEMKTGKRIASHTQTHANKKANDLEKRQRPTKESPHRQHNDNDKEATHINLKKKAIQKDEKKGTHEMKNKNKIACHTEPYLNKREKGMPGHHKLTNANSLQRNRKGTGKESSHKSLKDKADQNDNKKNTRELVKENGIISHTAEYSSKQKKVLKGFQELAARENERLQTVHIDNSRGISHRKLEKKINETRAQLTKETKEYKKIRNTRTKTKSCKNTKRNTYHTLEIL